MMIAHKCFTTEESIMKLEIRKVNIFFIPIGYESLHNDTNIPGLFYKCSRANYITRE